MKPLCRYWMMPVIVVMTEQSFLFLINCGDKRLPASRLHPDRDKHNTDACFQPALTPSRSWAFTTIYSYPNLNKTTEKHHFSIFSGSCTFSALIPAGRPQSLSAQWLVENENCFFVGFVVLGGFQGVCVETKNEFGNQFKAF